jgi:hypothetical protein
LDFPTPGSSAGCMADLTIKGRHLRQRPRLPVALLLKWMLGTADRRTFGKGERLAATAGVVFALAVLAACDTEPPDPASVKWDRFAAKVRVGCLDTRGPERGGYDARWRVAYRKVGVAGWTQGPPHTYHCPDETEPHSLDGSPFTEPLTGMDDATAYEYRLEIETASGQLFRWYDADGTEGGINYERVTTAAHPSINAAPGKSLRDIIGINTRTLFTDTNYDCWGGDPNECNTVKEKLLYLGVRRIRDGINGNHPPQNAFLDDLSATTDIKLTFAISNLRKGLPYIDQQLALLDGADQHETRLRDLVTAIESVNEPDYYAWGALCNDGEDNDNWDNIGSPDGLSDYRNGQGDPQCDSNEDESERIDGVQTSPNWQARTRTYQQHLFDGVNANPLLADKPVIGVSFALNAEAEVGDLGSWVDVGNVHPYPGDTFPGDGASVFDQVLDRCRQYAGGKPCAGTEQGYHTAINQSPNGGVNQHVQAIYSLRFLLEAYIRGIPEFDFYNLVEQHPDSGQCVADTDGGLNTADWGWYDCQWNPNQVATAMHNFTQTIGDGGTGGTVKAHVEEAPADAEVRYFRAADGDLRIVVWRRVSSWDRASQTETTPAAQDVRISLPDAATVTKYVPTQGPNGISVPLDDRRVTVPVDDELVVLRVD